MMTVLGDTFSESVFDIQEKIGSFLEEFFKDEEEVLRFNINFIEDNGLEYNNKIDFMRLNRFISSAYRTIQGADSSVVGPLEQKFYKDLAFLTNFYKQFLLKKKEVSSVFKFQFLPFCGGINELVTLAQDESLDNPDAIGEFEKYLRLQFEHEFLHFHDRLNDDLRVIINTKTYYFDRLMWYEAKKSPAVIDFFKRINQKEGSNAELSTKTFILQYLKTVDITHAKDGAWHDYLKKVVGIME